MGKALQAEVQARPGRRLQAHLEISVVHLEALVFAGLARDPIDERGHTTKGRCAERLRCCRSFGTKAAF